MKNLFTKRICLFSIFALLTGTQTWAQLSAKKAFTDIAESSIVLKGERYTFPKTYRTLHLDKTEMQQLLSKAPLESASANRTSQVIFGMPMPGGTTSNFRIVETFVMHPDLAAKFPEIKTYMGQGIDDPDATIRLDFTPLGFHAMVLSPKGNVFIDPYSSGTTEDYICYYKKDLTASSGFVCETDQVSNNLHSILTSGSGEKSSGTQLRTYRLALACTGEYAATKGGTVSGAMAGMTTSMNRVNGVYETEVAIRMVMVANNNLIVYTNSSTDPYTNGNGSTMLGQNQTTCNNVIGSANYDIGHVFSTGGGGVAYLGCVCSSSNKAGGVTGNSNPVGDGFDIDYVAHEMGHQFGGSHTFNSSTGSCGGGNRTASAAFEPGSGITIMAYAGICGSDDLAPHSIAYFHTYSFDQIVNYSTTGNGNTCAVTTGSGNTAPVITSVGAAKSIPVSTPFVLTGAATDANGDPLTYSWEEYDLGSAGAWNVQSTTAPMFRPFDPVSSPSRTFPKLSDIINNTTTVGELLPNQARTLKFRLTARDNRTGGGGVMHPDTTLNISVVNNGGAFA
ncbi:MAG: reprolysin-like metallopeptidase, partial [Bacteroidota bacterium]